MKNKPEIPESWTAPVQNPEKPDELEGLVLSLQDYKENDGIVKLALPDRIVSVYARGVLKSTSKNRRLCQPFSKVKMIYEPRYSRDMFYLIHGEVIWYDSRIMEDLLAQSICFVLRDIVIRSGMNPQVYQYLEQCWHGYQDQDKSYANLQACLVLAQTLRMEGIAPNVDGCTVCGRQNGIETMVLSQGGFVCRDCRRPEWPKLPREKLRAWRALFRAGSEHTDYLAEHFSYDENDIIELAEFWQYYTNIRLASLSFLITVAQMYKS